jgi:tRNA pseudouridine55 synthase
MTMPPQKPSGVLVLDKPAGISSARALNAIKGRLPRGTKVGHAGTLDPFATGVLVVLVGRATRSCERLMGLPKGYEAALRLGATTPTLDPESPESLTLPPGVPPPAREQVQEVLLRFVGEIEQAPPAFSAIKVAGRRAYDLARGGEAVSLPPRRVRVDAIGLLDCVWPELRIFVRSGRGFYVRSLARDIGEALGVGAYLTALRRTFVGPFTLGMAAPPGNQAPALISLSQLETLLAAPDRPIGGAAPGL